MLTNGNNMFSKQDRPNIGSGNFQPPAYTNFSQNDAINMILQSGLANKKKTPRNTQTNQTLQMTLQDTSSNLTAKEAQVFYSNASNAQQIMN